ncbi:hypothetical protein QVD17_09014 [Tagetes erecta]|uniref:Uncharacterized protein n=1 Tax=Tagetes erecta TaxID=13708 RepID=A0AAD8P3J3_TARER|nr:hypothetical protein QVD17_09014 [Tagetes erecta]
MSRGGSMFVPGVARATAQILLRILSVALGDEDVIQCKIVSQIKADNIDHALSTILSNNNNFHFYKVAM